ncbi:hypothetical protein [Marivirga sp.]|uniref:hypothetical protein n=1 Tax=Marivirga sp. TaxID=2018662 RepID=UPI003DA74453
MGWNRSQLVDKDLFVMEFLDKINRDLSFEDRISFFYISKNYTIATNEVKEGNMTLAKHYFDKANSYAAKFEQKSLHLFRLSNNVYYRSYSLFLFKQNEPVRAKEMIIESMKNNLQIVEYDQDYLFILFDTAQQYLNLSQLFFVLRKPLLAKRIYIEVINYLISGNTKNLPFLKNLDVLNESENYKNLRTILCLETILSFYTKILDENNLKKEFYLFSHKITDDLLLKKDSIIGAIILMIKSKINNKDEDIKYYENYVNLNYQIQYQKYFQKINTLMTKLN